MYSHWLVLEMYDLIMQQKHQDSMGITGDETQGAYKFTTAGEEIQINVIPFKEVVKVL